MTPSADLLCCPICDALHRLDDLPDGRRARCIRCNTVLGTGKPEAITRIVVLAATSLILMTIVVFYPFLQLRQGVFTSKASVFDTVMTFSSGAMAPLSIAVGLFIIILPVTRLALLVWSLFPLSIGRPPWPGASRALRWSEVLRPWAMAEIFMVGVAIALVKLADLATLTMGPAFWSFAAIVFITALGDTQMSKHTIWTALDDSTR
ncbi:paraquat-inducible protein A [Jannaschia aquimarina]|uniref:YebS protein n=1 Tax=Jannaschia aquimarina TaxID=935700 RepID=A0A0D1D5Z6_9RHOB|nr:paraquat-inducible protein A [Jannaschia aquimarina]KIT15403.1 Inner membrane protein YebS [Jannaschia aquimarina]SNT22802.1 paraquat-inducible protein A [Jannaschia aquimarina]